MNRTFTLFATVALLLGAVGETRADYLPLDRNPPQPNPSPAPVGSQVDPVYNFVFSIQGNIGYGSINTVASGLPGDAGYHAFSGTITVTGGNYLGTYSLVTGGPTVVSTSSLDTNGTTYYDNLLYPGNDAGSGAENGKGSGNVTTNPSYLDTSGLLFSSGGASINIWGLGGSDGYEFDYYSNNTMTPYTPGTFNLVQDADPPSVSTVPEPAAGLVFGMMSAGAGYIGWRRRK
jgi:hypothetical protein